MKSDFDFMLCDEQANVIEDAATADQKKTSLLIVRDLDTPAGYVKLQVIGSGVPCTFDNSSVEGDHEQTFFENNCSGRLVLSDLLCARSTLASRSKNKPAFKSTLPETDLDVVISYRCRTWPAFANEWHFRQRLHGWPTKETIQDLKSLGVFVVRKGHPFSKEQNLEWRISFTLQERKLMINLTDVQHKCYVLLKLYNQDIICLDCVTSYHWKTCLFYVIEENNTSVWQTKLLFHCVKLCIKHMLKWVKCGICPSYFIPKDNLFDGQLNKSMKSILENKLENILNIGFDCLLIVKSDKICEYVTSRGSVNMFHSLQKDSKKIYKKMMTSENISVTERIYKVFDSRILEPYCKQATENVAVLIKYLWQTINDIQCIESITEHTADETKHALALLMPVIYTSLASNISAMAIQHPNLQVRNFLLFGSSIYLLNEDLTGRLKFISVLYSVGLYEECEWYLDQLDEQYIMNNPSLCKCRTLNYQLHDATQNIYNTSHYHLSTCISFLPTELSICPDAFKYEMFRHVGISLQKNDMEKEFPRWNYSAVIDSNIYFLLLKYLIKHKHQKFLDYSLATNGMLDVCYGKNVRHKDVAYNMYCWVTYSNNNSPCALGFLELSWNITRSFYSFFDLCFLFFTNEMKRKQSQFNSAKLRALVILYNTWFARKPTIMPTCFQCSDFFHGKLQACCVCKIATYCSK